MTQPDYRSTGEGNDKLDLGALLLNAIPKLKVRQTFMQPDMPCYNEVQELIESYQRSLFVLKTAENMGYPIDLNYGVY